MHASVDGRPVAPGRRTVAIGAVLSALVFSGLGTGATVGTAAAAPRAAKTAAKTAPKSAAKSKAEVKADWVAFFSAKTKPARRIQLLQNGQQFATVIRQASANPLASTLSASVSKVNLNSKNKARVTYALMLGGKPVLSHQQGTAIYQSGLWKVGDSSFCSLLVMENGGKKAGLPKACQPGKK